MEFLNTIWIFFQDQILGMKWLNLLIGDVLSVAGVDIGGRLGGSIQFFLYDVDQNYNFVMLVDFYDFIYPELFSTGKK